MIMLYESLILFRDLLKGYICYSHPPIAVFTVFFLPLQSLWVLQETAIVVMSITTITNFIFNKCFTNL